MNRTHHIIREVYKRSDPKLIDLHSEFKPKFPDPQRAQAEAIHDYPQVQGVEVLMT